MEKHETCKHAIKHKGIAVYVSDGCPKATVIKGIRVSSKKRCAECQNWKSKGAI